MKQRYRPDPEVKRLQDLNLAPHDYGLEIFDMLQAEYPKGTTDWLGGIDVNPDGFGSVYVSVRSDPARDGKVKRLLRLHFPELDFDYMGGVGGNGFRLIYGRIRK